MQINTAVYKAKKKPDSYIYLLEKDNFSCLPEVLLASLGSLEWVMDLTLNRDKKLAQADARKVMKALQEDGFYLQMPDISDVLELAGKKPVSNPIPSLF